MSTHGSPVPPTPPSAAHAPVTLDARGLPPGYPFREQDEVTPRQTRDRLKLAPDQRPLLLDCRRDDEFAIARIAGAVLVPMQDVERRIDDIVDEAGGKGRPIIVHCHHGRRSLAVTAQLRAHGFTDVRSMAGGIDLWSIDIDPSVRRY
jgi:rhodanese-related sulfurtransferase